MLKTPILFFILVVLSPSHLLAQHSDPVAVAVLKKLNSIKPEDTDERSYVIKPAGKRRNLPQNLTLDLVYKIGHYEWDIVALRFERNKGQPIVSVTRIVYGSFLSFWKPYARPEYHQVNRARMTVSEFDGLLDYALRLYESRIEEEREPECVTRNDGSVSCTGVGSSSISMSSGDGSILIGLRSSKAKPVLTESGTLHAGDLRERAVTGIEYVRGYLFWEVFIDALKEYKFDPIGNKEAEDILVGRLSEPQLVADYRDYYRRSLYVKILGRLGTVAAILPLKSFSRVGLETNWIEHLNEDVVISIENIESRVK